MDKDKADDHRANYLGLCEELMDRVAAMRNYGMKPGNAWLAKAELAKISSLVTDIEQLLEEIKQADGPRN
ncbi:MAG TPA: hypothetical protein VLF41_00120 [Candidatus Nanoarchaeia archaeon]|nr:hypothetical protein [Candidatus Nanoarchaeia archaeon]